MWGVLRNSIEYCLSKHPTFILVYLKPSVAPYKLRSTLLWALAPESCHSLSLSPATHLTAEPHAPYQLAKSSVPATMPSTPSFHLCNFLFLNVLPATYKKTYKFFWLKPREFALFSPKPMCWTAAPSLSSHKTLYMPCCSIYTPQYFRRSLTAVSLALHSIPGSSLNICCMDEWISSWWIDDSSPTRLWVPPGQDLVHFVFLVNVWEYPNLRIRQGPRAHISHPFV